MKRKKKPIEHKKSRIEKQYEKYFTFLNCGNNASRITPTQQPEPKQNIQTWVTYGAFEEPIV